MTMESVEFINSLVKAVMILVRLAVVLRCGFLLLRMVQSDDDAPAQKKKIINTVIFYVLAESVYQLKPLVEHYFR